MSTDDQRERDEREIDALLRTAIGPASPAAAGDPSAACLDAETLAAWSAGALARPQAGIVEAHAAGCARCQAMLAAFARSEPGTGVFGESANERLVEPTVVDVHGRARPSPWQRWRIGWLVPIAATAAALAIWVATPSMPDADAPAPEPTAAAPGSLRDSFAAPPLTSAPAGEPPAARPAPARKAGAVRSGSQAGGPGAPAADSGTVPESTARSATSAPAPPAAAPTVAAPAANAAEPFAPPPGEAPSGRADAAAADKAVGEQERQRDRQSPEERTATRPAPPLLPAPAAAAGRLMSRSDVIEVGAGQNRWRIRHGDVAVGAEFSDTGGREWVRVSLPENTVRLIVAGAAAADRVCWLIGRQGTVLLTTDGVRFQRVAFPEALDLRFISAEDARRARVTAADGRTFATADGGATWARQP